MIDRTFYVFGRIYRARCRRSGGMYLAWCSPGKLTCDTPVLEKSEPVFFAFGQTEGEAFANAVSLAWPYGLQTIARIALLLWPTL